MRWLVAGLILLHGFLHLLGFLKAYQLVRIPSLVADISRFLGVFWLLATVFLIIASLLYWFKSSLWWIPASLGLLISMYLMSRFWADAKWGMIPNIILFIVLLIQYAEYHFKAKYIRDVKQSLQTTTAPSAFPDGILALNDLSGLPTPVKNYIIHTGFVGKPRIKNFKAISEGTIRKNISSDWIPLDVEQYNFIHPLTRLFYMTGTMKGLPVRGYHRFKEGHAYMDVRLGSLIKVQYQDGQEMDVAETVTYFNDLCVFAPGALPFKDIVWEVLDSQRVRGVFTEAGITIAAVLHFNPQDELTDFESDDRYFNQDGKSMKKIRWTTPLKEYKSYRGYRISSKAEAIWHFPEGPLTYARFNLKDIIYNATE